MKLYLNSRFIQRSVFAGVFLLSLFTSSPSSEAGVDYSVEVSQKFGRGLLNVLSSPLEIPCAIRDDVQEKGAAGVGTGFFKGIAFFLRRVLVGATEVGTFVIPMEATLPPVCAKKAEAGIQA